MRSIKNRGGLTRGHGLTEVRLTWIYRMHQCADFYNQMTMITGMKHKTSEQHIDLGRSRNTKDFQDLLKISYWFEQFNPFSKQEKKLHQLSNGHRVEECDEINCDDAELIGNNIQKDLDCKTVEEAKVSRNKQVRTLQISNWFEQFIPFSQQQTELYLLSTGYTAEGNDEINCYDAELIGYNIH